MDFIKSSGETDAEFILRCADTRGTLSWRELTQVLNRVLGKNVSQEAYRTAACRERKKRKQETLDPVRELEFAKQGYRDERNAWVKQNREQSRTETNLDCLEQSLLDISGEIFPKTKTPVYKTTKKSMLILLTDWHIGLAFDSLFGKYDLDIARERVGKILARIKALNEIYQCEQAFIMCLGDMINGNIRRTVQLQNRENIIDQIKNCTELLANFTKMTCDMFPKVCLTGAAGNHSRLIENKEDAVKDERLDSIITWATSLLLSHQDNFEYIEPLDTTLTSLTIYGREIWGVHGDNDKFGKGGMQNLSAALGRFPYAICMGHLHAAAYEEVAGVQLIRGGSLAGSGDDYTVQRRLTGNASQTICVINEEGIEGIFPVEL